MRRKTFELQSENANAAAVSSSKEILKKRACSHCITQNSQKNVFGKRRISLIKKKEKKLK